MAGLSQKEAAQLAGLCNRLQFAWHERSRSEPPLRVALANEHLFGVPTNQLFAGVSVAVAKRTKRRVQAYERKLAGNCLTRASRQLQHKMQWAADCLMRFGRVVYAA